MLTQPVVVRATVNLYTQVLLGNVEVNSLKTCSQLLDTLWVHFLQLINHLVLERIVESLSLLKLTVDAINFTHLSHKLIETNQL